jgi:competence protein ComEC
MLLSLNCRVHKSWSSTAAALPVKNSTPALLFGALFMEPKIAHVDILVMSHPDLDHYGGLAFVAEHFTPRELWFNGEQSTSPRFARLWTALERNGATFRKLCREKSPIQFIQFAEVRAQILHPPCQPSDFAMNNASLVLRLSYGSIDVLFTGDLEAEGERQVLAQNSAIASEVLKAPHHGSRTSSTSAFLNAVVPQVVIASLGYHNHFGFPARAVQRYGTSYRLLRTDLDGRCLLSVTEELHR